jgi:hypothetical protein
VWWNDDQNWKNILTSHEGWEEYAEHCLTRDPMPQTGEWHEKFDDIRVVSSAEEHLADTEGAGSSTLLLPTGIGVAPPTKLW